MDYDRWSKILREELGDEVMINDIELTIDKYTGKIQLLMEERESLVDSLETHPNLTDVTESLLGLNQIKYDIYTTIIKDLHKLSKLVE